MLLELVCTQDVHGHFIDVEIADAYIRNIEDMAKVMKATAIFAHGAPDGESTTYYGPFGSLSVKQPPRHH